MEQQVLAVRMILGRWKIFGPAGFGVQVSNLSNGFSFEFCAFNNLGIDVALQQVVILLQRTDIEELFGERSLGIEVGSPDNSLSVSGHLLRIDLQVIVEHIGDAAKFVLAGSVENRKDSRQAVTDKIDDGSRIREITRSLIKLPTGIIGVFDDDGVTVIRMLQDGAVLSFMGWC